MSTRIGLGALAMFVGVVGCNDLPSALQQPPLELVADVNPDCPLADVPLGAHVVLCFTTSPLPGVWSGWVLDVSDAQPPGTGNGLDFFDRDRLNHPYVLASPAGYLRWGPSDPLAPTGLETEPVHAFQPEWNGTLWLDVLRIFPLPGSPQQDMAIVVFWADAATVATDLSDTIMRLQSVGVFNRGQANSLVRKVDQAIKLLSKGKTDAAVEILSGFIQQVQDMAAGGVLGADDAQNLIRRSEYFIEVIQH